MSNPQPRILLVYTGGTIGMVEDPATGQLHPFNFSHLSAQIPELKKFPVQIDCHAFDDAIDSSNVTPAHWVRIASIIEESYEAYDGFVILHGSDTMAYTASALSFMLEGLAKPVILTGSQLPIGTIRTDGKENLITAIQVAAEKNETGEPMIPEVAVYFEYRLYRGNRTHKYNAEHFQAFHSPNYPELAQAGVHIQYNRSAIAVASSSPFTVQKTMCTDIAILKLFPGITEATVRAVTGVPGLRGLILESFGSGNAPTAPWFLQALQDAAERGVIIFNVSQCSAGRVEQGRYQTSALLPGIGVIGGSDITTEAAVTKMMYLFGKNYKPGAVRELLSRPLRGEHA